MLDLIIKNGQCYINGKLEDKDIAVKDGKISKIGEISEEAKEVYDVTGAGDTVIAALSIAYAKTNDIEFSAKFANTAAAIAVGLSGAAAQMEPRLQSDRRARPCADVEPPSARQSQYCQLGAGATSA